MFRGLQPLVILIILVLQTDNQFLMRNTLLVAILLILTIGSIIFVLRFFLSNKGEKIILVSRVVDTDTVELTNGKVIRLIGINAPEKMSFILRR